MKKTKYIFAGCVKIFQNPLEFIVVARGCTEKFRNSIGLHVVSKNLLPLKSFKTPLVLLGVLQGSPRLSKALTKASDFCKSLMLLSLMPLLHTNHTYLYIHSNLYISLYIGKTLLYTREAWFTWSSWRAAS